MIPKPIKLGPYILDNGGAEMYGEFTKLAPAFEHIETDVEAVEALRQLSFASDPLFWMVQGWRDYLQSYTTYLKDNYRSRVIA